MSDYNYVSKEAYEQMKMDLQKMKSVDRPAASRAIAEYDAAKEAQGLLEAKIQQMEAVLSNVRILDAKDIDTSKVSLLSRVTITNLATKKSVTYQIVGEKESYLKSGKISVTSPIHQ